LPGQRHEVINGRVVNRIHAGARAARGSPDGDHADGAGPGEYRQCCHNQRR
jgi:hypothetical protein